MLIRYTVYRQEQKSNGMQTGETSPEMPHETNLNLQRQPPSRLRNFATNNLPEFITITSDPVLLFHKASPISSSSVAVSTTKLLGRSEASSMSDSEYLPSPRAHPLLVPARNGAPSKSASAPLASWSVTSTTLPSLLRPLYSDFRAFVVGEARQSRPVVSIRSATSTTRSAVVGVLQAW